MMNFDIQNNKAIVERKICYDSTVVEHNCKLLKIENQKIVLLHEIEQPFSMMADQKKVTISKGSYTFAYYWLDQPYNLYFWRNKKGDYLGAYFNLVRNTNFKDNIVSFEDLIIDVLVLPDEQYFILDEEELPQPLQRFENGFVQNALNSLFEEISNIIQNVERETENFFKHG